MPTSLSVAIITYNEENNIRDCIDSVIAIADEVIVLDSYSTDATEQICREYENVKFSQHKFDGHINQKNRALAICNGDWILSIDADERVTPELASSIRKFLAENSSFVAAKFSRLTFHMKEYIRHGGWYPNARYRLVKKGYAKWGGENPHDKILIDGEGVTLSGDLIHYSFKDLSHQVDTINKFSSIKAFTRFEKGRKFHLWRLLFKPLSKFVELYVIKKGFMDGIRGFIIAVSSTYATFLAEAKLYEMDRLKLERISNLPSTYKKQS